MILASGNEIRSNSRLFDTMFRDRAKQFHTRLNWNVCVDENGHERDEFDNNQTLYLISVGKQGEHKGSIRLLPSTGKTLFDQCFSHIELDRPIVCPRIWECSRFCLAPSADHIEARRLFLAAREFGIQHNIDCFFGVFEEKMKRLYKRIGWEPIVIGASRINDQSTYVGLWEVAENTRTLSNPPSKPFFEEPLDRPRNVC